jgi:hypothetical protein
MKANPNAGKPPVPAMLVNVPRLVTAYFTDLPDPSLPEQRVAFGTSGHRGSSLDRTFNEGHVLAISQAIFLYRARQRIDGPLFLGIDTHALSVPAFASALEVLAANGVEVMVAQRDEYTPTPAVSHAILTYNQGRRTRLADGIVVTPSHIPLATAASNTIRQTADRPRLRLPTGMEAAIRHCTVGLGIWTWASNDAGVEPDVVMACAGDVPTLETLAAVDLLRTHLPDLKIRVVNVVDLMTLQPATEHSHGLSDREFDSIFTPDKPLIFAFHGYPWLIHRLTYRRTNHHNIHVRGYKEEGTTTTPFDMTVLNDLDRFHLAGDVIDRVPRLQDLAGHVKQRLRDTLVEHRHYVERHGDDLPEVKEWRWPAQEAHPAG